MVQDTATTERKLLIVDDSKVSRMRIRAFFAAQCPAWSVDEAGTGEEAIEKTAAWAPDYVTMDVNMPGMSGFDAAQKIVELRPGVRMVMLTANIQESSRERAQRMGVLFVAKPVTDAAVLAVVEHFESAGP